MFFLSHCLAVLSSLFMFFFPVIAQAYIGPGAGISAIGSLLALLAGVGFAIFGFFWYPLKRLMKKRKKNDRPSVEMKKGGESDS